MRRQIRAWMTCVLLMAGLPLGCDDHKTSAVPESGGAGGAGSEAGGATAAGNRSIGAGGSAGTGGVHAGAGGAPDDQCTYQGVGASDPMPVPLDCQSMPSETYGYQAGKLCVGATHAAFVAAHCGAGYLCMDYGDWGTIEATVDEGFGQVVSAVPIGCDRFGVEVVIELAPGATTGTLTLGGTIKGFESCHGADVTCPIEEPTTYPLDVSATDCSGLEFSYCGSEAASRLDLVIGQAGAGGAPP